MSLPMPPTRPLLLACLLLTLTGPARAQTPPPSQSPPDGSGLHVYLLTMGPGGEVWERFGHNAIRIEDDRTGADYAFNWGVFDFDQPGFLRKFVQGRMLYMMAGYPTDATLDEYRAADRSLWQQELNLTARQKAALLNHLLRNVRPENREYRYDYFKDNCSTRVRDALDAKGVLGGQIKRQIGGGDGRTLRFHADRLMAADPLAYTGIRFALGTPVDRPISVWQELYIPMELMRRLRGVTVTGDDGIDRPLAGPPVELVHSTKYAERMTPPDVFGLYFWPLLAIGGAVGGAICGLGRIAGPGARSRAARFFAAALAIGWSTFAGLAGVFLVALWAFTDHWAANPNLNLPAFDPLLLPLAAILPLAASQRKRWPTRARALIRFILTVAVLGLLAEVLPAARQSNANVLALGLPPLVGIWAWLRRLGRVGGPAEGTPALVAGSGSPG